jgi:hypothetical protein
MAHEPFANCIEAYICADACNQCAMACLTEPDVKAMARCVALAIDCAQACHFAAAATARGSEYTAIACALCADICEACSQESSKFPPYKCQRCAEACKRCAEECRSVAQQAGGAAARSAH